jgi:predicted small metal-binding protein
VRMMECNICGEPLVSADDDELVARLIEHFESEHPGSELDEDALRQAVEEEAYDASDS